MQAVRPKSPSRVDAGRLAERYPLGASTAAARRRSREESTMLFTQSLRERIRDGSIRCSIRIWTRPHVKVGGRYPMDWGHIVVKSVEPISLRDVTQKLARESGFDSVDDLLQVAKHGRGNNVYLI